MGLEILIILLFIVLSGVFSMAEMAILTARKSRLGESANKGNARARAALELANAPTRFVSTVQIGTTSTAVLAGAFAGRTVAGQVAAYVKLLPGAEPYGEAIAFALVVVGVSYFTLIIGELVPKRLALRYPEAIAAALARPMRAATAAFSPIVHLVSLSGDAVIRVFGRQQVREPTITEEEIKTLVEKGTEAGVFEESEQNMVEAVFSLGDRSARSMMTPRTQIIWLDVNASDDHVRAKVRESGYSRYPVASVDLDHVTGVVQAKDLLAHSLVGRPADLKSILQEPLFVPRSVSALHVLELFKQSGKHIALVVDEYGGIEGLLTHHDILEAIAGEIAFGGKSQEPKAVQRHDGSWLLDGMLAVDEFKELFHLDDLPGEKKDAYQTLGGFLFTQMGRVPSVSDRFIWGKLNFEIVDMDGKRIDKVLVTTSSNASP
ncbi:MAG TPA: hemolysin family protein [Candidatus Binatia bacterium]|jgi:putative hemolysin